MIVDFFWLISGHFICDYVLQSTAMAMGKRRAIWQLEKAAAVALAEETIIASVPWYYWMFAHALTHGLCVAFVFRDIRLGIAELIAHFAIDTGKCEGFYGHHVDQFLHLVCKLGWLGLYYGAGGL